jgi:hypothetical protein
MLLPNHLPSKQDNMSSIMKRSGYRQRRPNQPTSSLAFPDPNWQPIGLVVRRLMKRLDMPRPTAIVQAEAAGFNMDVFQ